MCIRDRFHVRSRTLSHRNRLTALYMTVCACLTDSYDSTSMLYVSVCMICASVYVDDQQHEDFRAEHPVTAAQGKASTVMDGWDSDGWD